MQKSICKKKYILKLGSLFCTVYSFICNQKFRRKFIHFSFYQKSTISQFYLFRISTFKPRSSLLPNNSFKTKKLIGNIVNPHSDNKKLDWLLLITLMLKYNTVPIILHTKKRKNTHKRTNYVTFNAKKCTKGHCLI